MNYAVVLAGGKGQRFGSKKLSKQFVELTGVPMIVYSLLTAEKKLKQPLQQAVLQKKLLKTANVA